MRRSTSASDGHLCADPRQDALSDHGPVRSWWVTPNSVSCFALFAADKCDTPESLHITSAASPVSVANDPRLSGARSSAVGAFFRASCTSDGGGHMATMCP